MSPLQMQRGRRVATEEQKSKIDRFRSDGHLLSNELNVLYISCTLSTGHLYHYPFTIDHINVHLAKIFYFQMPSSIAKPSLTAAAGPAEVTGRVGGIEYAQLRGGFAVLLCWLSVNGLLS